MLIYFFPNYFLIVSQLIWLNIELPAVFSYLITDYNITSYERQALYDLYNSTNGDHWIYQEGNQGHWDFTDPNVNPCLSNHTWQGLNCTTNSTASSYYISKIMLSEYNLDGILPDSIGNFSHLQYLDLSNNFIIRKIPKTISKLSKLIELDLSYNSLTGTLPISIYELSALQKLNLDSNLNLNGTISELIGQLSHLQYLNLNNNLFMGSIPSTFGNLSALIYLKISLNYFIDRIPTSIRSLSFLNTLIISYNELTGSITSGIGDLSLLTILALNDNHFTGIIPSSFANLTKLVAFSFGNNELVGTIPIWIGNLSSLQYISLGGNHLTSTIPSSLSKLKSLLVLSVGTNALTGTIPHWIGDLSLLFLLDLGPNLFTSTLPFSISNLKLMIEFYLQYNLLVGSIPDIFINFNKLRIIEFQSNYFTGSLPDSLSKLTSLTRCFIQDNHLSGHLNKAFNGSYQTKLSNIQLSNNQFSGKLPEQVFLSQRLIAFSAVSNCFEGNIPVSICSNSKLQTLALDGLVCASSCRNKIIPSISNAYISEKAISGGIPNCLLTMPNLKVLHLSGNSLTGSLPDHIKWSDSLQDLSLSYNTLTGSIPSNIQERIWYNLDLSHNRFSGTLIKHNNTVIAHTVDNNLLSLKNNRLSGNIPLDLHNIKKISILEGNSYNCKYDRSDLPANDEYRITYECGSNTFNLLYFTWLGMIFIVCTLSIFYWYYRNDIKAKNIQLSLMIEKFWNWIHVTNHLQKDFTNENYICKYNYFKQYDNIHVIILRFSFYCTIVIIVLLLPIYATTSYYYATHTYEYAWTVSILYLSGKIAFGIIMCSIVLFMITDVYIFHFSVQSSSYDYELDAVKQYKKDHEDKVAYNKSNNWRIYSMYFIYTSINLIIVSGVNAAYVYIVLSESKYIVFVSQIFLSIFKMVWNNIISPRMVRLIIDYLSILNTTNLVYQRRLFFLQFLVSLSNNVIIPCFIVAIISPNCFYNIFQQESEERSSYTYNACSAFDDNISCVKYKTVPATTSYSPPFTYSYQCSSEFVTYYASVYVLLCIFSTFIVPLVDITVLYLSQHYNAISVFHELRKLLNLNNSESSPLINIDDIYEILVSMLTLVGLLLTFGAVFPPLAIALLITITRRIYYHKAILGRYISYAIECKNYSCLDIINEDCKVIPLLSTIERCSWVLLYVSCTFYTLFLFDILGDDVGVQKAYWVLIVTPCIPLCMHIIYKLYKYWLVYKEKEINKQKANDITTSDSMIFNKSIDGIELTLNPLYSNNDNKNNEVLNDSDNNSNNNNNNNGSIILDDIYVEDREGSSIMITASSSRFEYINQ